MTTVIVGIVAFIIGFFLGVTTMCIFQVGKRDDVKQNDEI